MLRLLVFTSVIALVVGCVLSPNGEPKDSGFSDARRSRWVDANAGGSSKASDSGDVGNTEMSLDAGGSADAGSSEDTGSATDVGQSIDSGLPGDGGDSGDVGTSADAGQSFDAGQAFDAGQPDGAVAIDSISRFESYARPNHYIRHAKNVGRIDADVSPLEDSEFVIVRGLADPQAVSFESINSPGYYLRHANFKLWLDSGVGAYFREDATFLPIPGLADGAKISFRSYNIPSHYITETDFLLGIVKVSSESEKASATFVEHVVGRKETAKQPSP
jgi:hypothetical protein